MQKVRVYIRSGIAGTHTKRGRVWYVLQTDTARGPAEEGYTEEVVGTENRAHIIALIGAMKRIRMPCEVHVYTKSSYLAGGWKAGWLDLWKQTGWKTAKGKPVRYAADWKKLLDLAEGHRVVFHVGETGDEKLWESFGGN